MKLTTKSNDFLKVPINSVNCVSQIRAGFLNISTIDNFGCVFLLLLRATLSVHCMMFSSISGLDSLYTHSTFPESSQSEMSLDTGKVHWGWGAKLPIIENH